MKLQIYKKYVFGMWWCLQASILMCSFLELRIVSFLIILGVCALFLFPRNEICKYILLFFFLVCSFSLSVLFYLVACFGCHTWNSYSVLFILLFTIISFLNYVVTIFTLDKEYLWVLMIVCPIYLMGLMSLMI